MENGNDSQGRNGRTDETRRSSEPIQVEDLEEKQSSLKRPLTPPINVNSAPPTKRFGSNEEVEGKVKGLSDDIVAMDTSVVETIECTDKDDLRGVGEVNQNVTVPGMDNGSGCEPAIHLRESTDLLPCNIPKIYDLFATCVS